MTITGRTKNVKKVDFHIRMEEKLYKKMEKEKERMEEEKGVELSMNECIQLVLKEIL